MKNILLTALLFFVSIYPDTSIAQKAADTSIYSVFASGGSCIVPMDALIQWGADSIGRRCGQFITTTKDMDAMLENAKTGNCFNSQYIQYKLGIPNDAWGNKILVRIDIPKDSLKSLNLRWPTRTDCGVNSDWKPGGKTSGGAWEGFVNRPGPGYFVLKADLVPCYTGYFK